MYKTLILYFFISSFMYANNTGYLYAQDGRSLIVRKTTDFEITGNGSSTAWSKTQWITIPQHTKTGQTYVTRAKVLYSGQGMYFLYECEDKKLTATLQADFLDLWNEDVIEVFLQPDKNRIAYLEYELSPLNFELPIMIYNDKGKLNSWMPFHYGGNQKTKHMVTVRGGEQKPHADVQGWTAEFFLPFTLMKPVLDKAPVSGDQWKGNIFRIDYDKGQTLFSWQKTGPSFHEYDKFGTFIFE